MSKIEIRLAGSGGQGIILASVILAEAALLSGKHTAQSQSYGPEARGGSCKAETIVSDEPIGFTKVTEPSLIMALTQSSADKYLRSVPSGCSVLVDESVSIDGEIEGKVYRLPILSTAKSEVRKAQTANIVAVAAINSILGIADEKTLEKAVLMHVPKGTESVNIAALECGSRIAREAR